MTDVTVLTLILVGLLAGLFTGKVVPAICFACAALACYLFGLVDLSQALNSFTNSGLITLVLLILVASALEKTYLLSKLSQFIAKESFPMTLVKLGFSTALLSSFTNNTAVIASLIGPVQKNSSHSASKLLLPLNYATILGGTMTLIGTSTSLIVNSFVEHAGLAPLSFFEFTQVGVVLVIAGMLLLLLLSHRLPERGREESEIGLPYLLEARIGEYSSLIGQTVLQNQLRALKKLYLVELERNGVRMSPVPPNMVLLQGDTLRFSGAMESVELLHQFDGLEWFGKQQANGQNLIEAVIAPSSSLVGVSLKQAQFRERFSAAVLAIRRGCEPLKGGLGDVILRPGDVLLLSPGVDFKADIDQQNEFAALNGLDLALKLDKKRSHWVMFGFAATLAMSLIGLLSLAKGLILLLLVFLVSGILTMSDIKRRFPVTLVTIVGSALCLADLMLSTGLADNMAKLLSGVSASYGVFGAFVGVYFLTLLLTELITNNAAAALAFPIGLAIAASLGVDAKPFILAVVFGASASFISPYGYQTNLMVFNAGGYRFKDFISLGLPLSILYSSIVVFLVPLWFPF
ncbi:SLC13 family permease [Parashewanella spongiae]|uniref:SLC13 family permease n=1 Tax=Parashewanella spongiae TaxID=342950 RepID=A0A3A6UFA9_9GAMM|nr:SLC13 family permease [Parashewanella spongiae]MCL1078719.1 SLC13 family permease [Parashewanella spongiae]RJY17496.1 SLC13 family permease [Parashewanella spongiae]